VLFPFLYCFRLILFILSIILVAQIITYKTFWSFEPDALSSLDDKMRVDHIERRIEQQLTLKDLIENAYDNLAKVGYSNITSHRVNARLTFLKENWGKFSIIHDAITLSMTKLSSDEKTCVQRHLYFSGNLFSITNECYLESVEKMTSLLNSENQITTRT